MLTFRSRSTSFPTPVLLLFNEWRKFAMLIVFHSGFPIRIKHKIHCKAYLRREDDKRACLKLNTEKSALQVYIYIKLIYSKPASDMRQVD